MRLTWLGQAGFLVESSSGLRIMIDPYLSDSLHETQGEIFRRQVPVNEKYLQMQIDVLVLTHGHADHADPGTLRQLLGKEPICVLAPLNTWRELRETYGGGHNYIQFDRGIQVTFGDVTLKATLAAHSDERAVGVVVEADGKVVFHTGDTLYHREIPAWLDDPVDTLIVPINGQGNNMNVQDAAKLTRLLAPAAVIPMHYDMFKTPGGCAEDFAALFLDDTVRVLIPEHYESVEI